jgi:DNA-binding NarL/FixJ family response regulator
MPVQAVRPPRVLLGNLEPIVRLGMATVLAEDDVDVIAEKARPLALVQLAGRLRPDAVILDLGNAESRELGESVRTASPETTVLYWARDEELMEVVAPGASAPRRVLAPVPEELSSALKRCR